MIRILIALDGSELSEQALLHGAAIAHAFESELLLVRVLSSNETGTRTATDAIDWKLQRRQVESYLKRCAQELKATGLNVKWKLEEGRVAERLICYAKQQAIDLIILGALGRSGIGSFARGGTAQKVISAATTSVLIAPPGQDSQHTGKFVYKRILVPVDGSCGSQWALNMAAAIAEIDDAELILMQVIETSEPGSAVPDSREARELRESVNRANRAEAERHLKTLKAKIPNNLRVTCEVVVSNHVPHAINQMANARDVSLVALNANNDQHTCGWQSGPAPEYLLSHMDRPVVVFRQQSGVATNNFHSTYLSETHVKAHVS
jgi:nucleotide-binding universal stress UspA family protein